MRIGDKAVYTGTAYPWAAGQVVEIKGIIRANRTFKTPEEIGPADQVIFSLTDADGFRCSVPDARLGDFEETGIHNARLNVDAGDSNMIDLKQ